MGIAPPNIAADVVNDAARAAALFSGNFTGGTLKPPFNVRTETADNNTGYFLTAAIFNFVPVLLAGAVPIEYGIVGVVHVLFMIRLLLAKSHAAHQRANDLERFQKIRDRN